MISWLTSRCKKVRQRPGNQVQIGIQGSAEALHDSDGDDDWGKVGVQPDSVFDEGGEDRLEQGGEINSVQGELRSSGLLHNITDIPYEGQPVLTLMVGPLQEQLANPGGDRMVHLDVEDWSEELLRLQSYAIKNQLGHPKPPTTPTPTLQRRY